MWSVDALNSILLDMSFPVLCYQQKWLDDDTTVLDNGMDNGMPLELRPRERIVKIKLLDGSSKMLWIDFSKPVRGVVSQLCDQLGITCAVRNSIVFIASVDK
jgi:hypothetical protein